jgi:hypothetical protein
MNSSGAKWTPTWDALEPFFSRDRLAPYLMAVGGDTRAVFPLYQWNAQVGAAFFESLGHLEVFLRNALDRQLRYRHTSLHLPGEWYDDSRQLDGHRVRDIEIARERLRQNGKAETHGRLIAELSFGFWRFLLGPRYQATLWAPALRFAFPHLRPQDRRAVYGPVVDLNRLRNRVAHHEPVHHLDLFAQHQNMLRIADFMNVDVYSWMTHVSRVPKLLASKPSSDGNL